MIDNDKCILPGEIIIKTHVRHSDRCKTYGHRSSISRIVDNALIHPFLSIAILPSNALSLTRQRAVLYPIPQVLKELKLAPIIRHGGVVISVFRRCSDSLYPTNDSHIDAHERARIGPYRRR